MLFEVKVVERWPGSVIVRMSGRLDGQTVGSCETTLKEQVSNKTRFMSFNLEDLDYIRSMGIRLLMIYRKAMEKRGGNIIMSDLQPQIKKVIDIANVLPSWGIFETTAEADAYFDKMQREAKSGEA
jgi:anti-sigma B factor antagonist